METAADCTKAHAGERWNFHMSRAVFLLVGILVQVLVEVGAHEQSLREKGAILGGLDVAWSSLFAFRCKTFAATDNCLECMEEGCDWCNFSDGTESGCRAKGHCDTVDKKGRAIRTSQCPEWQDRNNERRARRLESQARHEHAMADWEAKRKKGQNDVKSCRGDRDVFSLVEQCNRKCWDERKLLEARHRQGKSGYLSIGFSYCGTSYKQTLFDKCSQLEGGDGGTIYFCSGKSKSFR
uniref:Uncharacterized protein n=1 Tax=Chromera velia CCMP2878 TaxID=1169474 RepID=A0A0G4GF65_9ALVE|eukprot:Cvel_21619.t1-p1 / transcript=Cvel_21619.t1 / gene=Cvel_21619 / organism=Chromera_velia_CCMP2878 / gene_product=hypothetical protein / transcript_product=hypothetical protein / location=Cvel_scaffold2043:9088-10526(-) / protein_length=237 / sequence_SO=supercontig / SO=protein_coding / is_pseudo=false